jgi:hypothetical protein
MAGFEVIPEVRFQSLLRKRSHRFNGGCPGVLKRSTSVRLSHLAIQQTN